MNGFELWWLAAAANVVMIVVYSVIGYTIWSNVARGRQWRSNPLAVSMGAIFVVCTLGHGAHLVHAFLPSFGSDLELGRAARATFTDWRFVAWDVTTAIVAVWYLSLRGRLKLVWRGAALFEDMKERQRHALDMHDSVVQGLAKAKLALDVGNRAEGMQYIEETLADSKRIITDILGEEGSEIALGAGRLRRKASAGEADDVTPQSP